MSRAAKSVVIGLLLLLFVAVGVIAFMNIQKQNIEKAKSSLVQQVEEFQLRETRQLTENKNLNEKISSIEQAKTDLEERLKKLDVNGLDSKIAELTKERDDWRNKVEVLQKEKESLSTERDDLLAKVKEIPEPQIIYKYIEPQNIAKSPEEDQLVPETATSEELVQTSSTSEAPEEKSSEDEGYWAGVLKEKAELELKIEKLNEDLTNNSVEIVELKKINSDMQLEVEKLTNDKESIEREIKYGKDLSDSLSLALARAENDKKFLNDRIVKFNEENTNLRDQIKRLSSTKIALEKSIVRLQDEKKNVEKKLVETENVIQNRIDEIWDIKQNLQDSFHTSKTSNSGEVELSPIVVSSSEGVKGEDAIGLRPPGFNGNVVSVNDENNFVIVNIGKDAGLQIGDSISVYRGAEFVAALEIIQVRKDIAAADIKNKVAKIEVGDLVH
jgi:hypothetical protein